MPRAARGNRVVLDLADGVSVTARRQRKTKVSNQAAYQSARATLLSSQVRALEKAIASKLLESSSTPDTTATQFALQKQLTDARITASNVVLLRNQVNELATTMTSIERRWSALKDEVTRKLKALADEYTSKATKLRTALRSATTRPQHDALTTSLVKLNDLYQLNKSNIISSARGEKDRLSIQLANSQSALLEKKMELEKSIHADRQIRVLQTELDRFRPVTPRSVSVRRSKKRKSSS
jgi:hypothetical protein